MVNDCKKTYENQETRTLILLTLNQPCLPIPPDFRRSFIIFFSFHSFFVVVSSFSTSVYFFLSFKGFLLIYTLFIFLALLFFFIILFCLLLFNELIWLSSFYLSFSLTVLILLNPAFPSYLLFLLS